MIVDGKIVRTVMREFAIKELSGVTRPAQAGALAVLVKHDTENTMDIQKLQADLAAALEINKQLQERLETSEKLASLTAAEKLAYDATPADERPAFLAKSHSERAELIKSREEADPVLYTRADGTKLRKSDGETVVQLAKQTDELIKQNQALVEKAEWTEVLKAAGETMSHLPKSIEAKATLLKFVRGVKDAAIRTELEELLKACDAEMAKGDETVGHGGAGPDLNKQAELDAAVVKYATEHKISTAKAYADFLATPEGRALYAALDKSAEIDRAQDRSGN